MDKKASWRRQEAENVPTETFLDDFGPQVDNNTLVAPRPSVGVPKKKKKRGKDPQQGRKGGSGRASGGAVITGARGGRVGGAGTTRQHLETCASVKTLIMGYHHSSGGLNLVLLLRRVGFLLHSRSLKNTGLYRAIGKKRKLGRHFHCVVSAPMRCGCIMV